MTMIILIRMMMMTLIMIMEMIIKMIMTITILLKNRAASQQDVVIASEHCQKSESRKDSYIIPIHKISLKEDKICARKKHH